MNDVHTLITQAEIDQNRWRSAWTWMWSDLGRQLYCYMCGVGLGNKYDYEQQRRTSGLYNIAPLGGMGAGMFVPPDYKYINLCRPTRERDCAKDYSYEYGSWSHREPGTIGSALVDPGMVPNPAWSADEREARYFAHSQMVSAYWNNFYEDVAKYGGRKARQMHSTEKLFAVLEKLRG